MTTTELAPKRAPGMDMGSLADLTELGSALAASGYFSDAKDVAQAVTKVLAGRELGFGPIASMTGVYIVKGRVTLSANLMAAAIKRHPKYDYRVKDLTDDMAVVAFFEHGQEVGSSEFTIKDAQRAGLAGGENWKKYPRNMLLWRAMSNGAKFYCPDVFAGAPVYTPDELGAEVDPESGEVIEASIPSVTATAVQTTLRPSESASTPEPVAPASAGEQAADVPAQRDIPASAASPEPESEDLNRQVSADEVDALKQLLGELKAPESFWRMALMGFGAAEFEALSVGQARELMDRANERFGVRT